MLFSILLPIASHSFIKFQPYIKCLLFAACLIFLPTIASAQIDPKKIDSLSRSIDSSRKFYQGWQDSLIRKHDSIQQSNLHKTDTLIKKLQENKADKKRKWRWYAYMFVTIIFLVALIAGVIHRSHRSKWYK